MSWPVASFLILGLALAAGFAWYEREHPSSRVLALVATLAALAALGRVAFEPIPNVKPTGAIVLVGGAALGGPAGFATGAIAALASNIVFGQGPWTPFQMLGFGLTGLLGAALGRACRGRPCSRLALATACFAAGMLYGVVVDFGTAVTGGGRDLWPRFAAMNFGTSLPWNILYASTSAGFALAFGPALQRTLLRFRARFTVTWRPAATLPLALVAVLGALALAAPAALAASPRSYLLGAQNGDGGWGERAGAPSSPLYTGWASLGLAGYGVNPLDQVAGGHTPINTLSASVPHMSDTGALERSILVLGAAGVSPRHFAGRDLVGALLGRRTGRGAIRGGVTLTAFGVLALRAGGYGPGSGPVRRATGWLLSQQHRDGGWNFAGKGGGSTPDDTGAVLQALAAAGRGHGKAARRGASWLTRHQSRDGGFSAFGTSNAQSTAYAIQGLVAAGRDPGRLHRRGARSPLAYLRTLIARNGSVRYSRGSGQTPVWVTGQAALALERRAFPLRTVARAHIAHPGPPAAAATPSAAGTSGANSGGEGSGSTAHARSAANPRNSGGSAAPGAAPLPGGVTTAVRVAGVLSALALAPFPNGTR